MSAIVCLNLDETNIDLTSTCLEGLLKELGTYKTLALSRPIRSFQMAEDRH